jgi:alkylation response protein AidB-like acyl-CoA dehydrogenase/AcrR family transcriptional regulator
VARPLDDDVRRRIVLATFSLVAAHGVQGMTMRQVAETTGLSTGTVTYHFGTKRALLFAAVDYYYEGRPRPRPAADADALASLRVVLRRYDLSDPRVETWWRFWLAVNAHAQRGDADLHERLAQHHHGALDVFRRLVATATADGTLRPPVAAGGPPMAAAAAEDEGERLGLLAHGLAITQLVDPASRATAADRLAAELDRLAGAGGGGWRQSDGCATIHQGAPPVGDARPIEGAPRLPPPRDVEGDRMAVTEVVEESAELAEFRQRVRAWLTENAEPKRAASDDDEGDAEFVVDLGAAKAFQAKLYDAGLAGLTWSKDVGGQGLSQEFQKVFNEEASNFSLPNGPFTIGLGMVMPTIIEYGTDEQKERYVRKALRGEEIWSQLFSEPGAGSDVASLQTKAVRDGDEWTINGQKVWTTGAQHSDFGAIIARTNPDAPKHRGISMFIVSFSQPGVNVVPLKQMNGGSGFNEVFFDDVKVPHSAMVGPQDEGWRCAIAMLANERVAIGTGNAAAKGDTGIGPLVNLARERGMLGDRLVRQAIADIYIRARIQGFSGLRVRSALQAGKQPGPEASIQKLASPGIAKRKAELGMILAGAGSIAWDPDAKRGDKWAKAMTSYPSSRIAGGTDEIQRNIIGERVLGLPKEPQVDRDQPFKELRVGTQTRG